MFKRLFLYVFTIALLLPSIAHALVEECTFPSTPEILGWRTPNTLRSTAAGTTSFVCTGGSAQLDSNYILNSEDTTVVIQPLSDSVTTTEMLLTTESSGWDNDTQVGGTSASGQLMIKAGTMLVQAGTTLRLPGGLVVEGGKFKAAGAKIGEAIIESIDWASSTGGMGPTDFETSSIVITFDRDVAKLGLTTDMFLVMMDEDPAGTDTTLTGSTIQTGQGRTNSESYRASYAKWKWLDVITVAGATVTAELDQWEGSANLGGALTYDGVNAGLTGDGGGTPYVGKRGLPLVTAAALTMNESQWFNLSSALKVTGVNNLVYGDLGSHYVEFTTGACAGDLVKIMNVEDMGAGELDIIYVAGDTTSCGTAGSFPNVIIHSGFRRGDRVALVNPVTLDFSRVTDPTMLADLHGFVLWMGGSMEVEWTRFVRMGAMGRDTSKNGLTPATERGCNICLLQKDATTQPVSGYLRNIEIAYFNNYVNGTSVDDEEPLDTGVIYANSRDYNPSGACSRFPGTVLDLSGIEFSRIYMHDSASVLIGAGNHGVFADRVTNYSVSRARITHMSDDSSGWIQGTCGDDVTQRISYDNFLIYENIASEDTSQEGTTFNSPGLGYGSPNKSSNESIFGEAFFTNSLIMGMEGPGFNSAGVVGSSGIITGQAARGAKQQSSPGVPGTVWTPSQTLAGKSTMQIPGTGCKGVGIPAECCAYTPGTTINPNTQAEWQSVYPLEDAYNYSTVVNNSIFISNHAYNADGAEPYGLTGYQFTGPLNNSIVAMPSMDNRLDETAWTGVIGSFGRGSGTVWISPVGTKVATGNTSSCTVSADAAINARYGGRFQKIDLSDSLLFTPAAGSFGNLLGEVTFCEGVSDFAMERTYIALGGDGAEYSLGAGGTTNNAYLNGTVSMGIITANYPLASARIVDSTLSYSDENRFVSMGKGGNTAHNQGSWGCRDDLATAASPRCNLTQSRPDGSDSVYSGLCASARRNSVVPLYYATDTNYGDSANGFSDPQYNNTLNNYVGPSPVLSWQNSHAASANYTAITGLVLNPAVVTAVAHGISTGDVVYIKDITGTGVDNINGNVFRAGTVGADTIPLLSMTDNTTPIVSTWTWVSGGLTNEASLTPVLADNNFYIHDFVQAPGAGGCGKAMPKRLGLTDWEVSHSMLGDLSTKQWRSYSTSNLSLEIVDGI